MVFAFVLVNTVGHSNCNWSWIDLIVFIFDFAAGSVHWEALQVVDMTVVVNGTTNAKEIIKALWFIT